MSETELPDAPAPEQDELDEDDRLRPEFVDAVLDAVAEGDDEAARALVEPLHPADIADLFELTPHEDRDPLAKALKDLLDADVFAEMNDYVREDLIDPLSPTEVADLAGNSIPTMRSRSSRTWTRTSSARCCARSTPTIAPRSRRRCPIPRNPPAA